MFRTTSLIVAALTMLGSGQAAAERHVDHSQQLRHHRAQMHSSERGFRRGHLTGRSAHAHAHARRGYRGVSSLAMVPGGAASRSGQVGVGPRGPVSIYGYGYSYDPYAGGSFRAPDLLNDPLFRAEHKFDSHFPGRYSRRPPMTWRHPR